MAANGWVVIVAANMLRAVEGFRPQFANFSSCRMTGNFKDGRPVVIMSKMNFERRIRGLRVSEVIWDGFMPTEAQEYIAQTRIDA